MAATAESHSPCCTCAYGTMSAFTAASCLAHVNGWLADCYPYTLDDHPMLRTLTVQLHTTFAYNLSACASLRTLDLTLWKVCFLLL